MSWTLLGFSVTVERWLESRAFSRQSPKDPLFDVFNSVPPNPWTRGASEKGPKWSTSPGETCEKLSAHDGGSTYWTPSRKPATSLGPRDSRGGGARNPPCACGGQSRQRLREERYARPLPRLDPRRARLSRPVRPRQGGRPLLRLR